MSLAVVALGGLGVWGVIVSQNSADSLSQAGVQTSGHLRAIQALSLLDTSTDALEKGNVPGELAKLRRSQRVLDDALNRMDDGGVRETRQIARQSKPIVRRLKPAVERFLETPFDGDVGSGPEQKMEDIISELAVVLNDLDADPSLLLAAKLDSVTNSELTVRATAYVLIPLGLGGAAACGWLLTLYRRRSEAVMQAAIVQTADEARTDQLTELPNRRALLEELDHRCAQHQPFTLALADLNGFKRYNDTFGHPAGDALLKRLARNLAAASDGEGMAARLGGDEFCVLLSGDTSAADASALVEGALCDEGEGFSISSSSGVATVPADAADTEGALRVADLRMYAAKLSSQPSAEQAMSGAMMRMLEEHHPGLGGHVEQVAALAVACARTLGLPGDAVESIKRAAELHDLGKVGIPSEILSKTGPLNDVEWEFMRCHSLIGERILGGIPSLESAAALVRSSHERWDGGGYPDRLAGEEIPVGARIIFAADAFCAMTEERPYAKARPAEMACSELEACSGTQFDPAVVEALLAVLEERGVQSNADATPVLTT